METWRKVWRTSVKHLPTQGLWAFRDALLKDDDRWLQGATTTPPPLQCVQDWDCEAACAWGFIGWQSGEIGKTVAEVEDFFAQTSFKVDQELGETAACRWFLNWHDETDRDEVRRELLKEVELELARRDETDIPVLIEE